MIKIWLDDILNVTLWNKHHSVILDWDPEFASITYVNDIREADIVFVLLVDLSQSEEQIAYITKAGYSEQHIVVLNLFHSVEGLGECYTKGSSIIDMWRQFAPPKKILFLDQNLCASRMNLDDVITYDMVFQRHQAYHTEYEKYDLENRIYTRQASQKMYELDPISKNQSAKHFLAPMRTYEKLYEHEPRVVLRHRLRQLLDPSKGYISNLAKGEVISPQENSPTIIEAFNHEPSGYGGGTWWPAHNSYYNDSIVSVYVETITYGNTYRCVTEKTFDPLIKGNFILPFGYRGLIEDIREYGFRLPNWIDYSYDDLNDALRWEAYTDVVKQLLLMDQQVLYSHCINDIDILHHNRNIFYTTPRMSLISKIRDWINNS
jgi:hypothetical protein